MTEILVPRDDPQGDEPRWSPQTEEDVNTGVMTPLEADQREGLVEPEAALFPEPEAVDEQIDRRVDQGVTNYGGAIAGTGAGAAAEETLPHQRHTRPGWVKDGSRRRIKTSADARAADRLPDEDWRFR